MVDTLIPPAITPPSRVMYSPLSVQRRTSALPSTLFARYIPLAERDSSVGWFSGKKSMILTVLSHIDYIIKDGFASGEVNSRLL